MHSIMRLRRFLTPYRWTIVIALVMLAVSAAADLAIPRLAETVIDTGIPSKNVGLIVRLSLAGLGVSVLSAAMQIGNALLGVRIAQKSARDLRLELFAHVHSLSFANLDRFPTGNLMIRLTSDVMQILQLIVMTLRMFVRAPLLFLGSVTLLLLTDARLALVILLLIPLMAVILILFATRTQPMFLRVQRKLDRLNTVLQENLAGVRVVKAFVREEHEAQRFGAANDDLMQQAIRVGLLLSVVMPLLSFFINLGTVAIVWVGGLQAIGGTLTVGEIVAFNNYLMTTMFPIINLGMMVGFISSADASAQRIFEVLDEVPRVRDCPQPVPLPTVRGRVALENVSFSYDGDAGEPVLKGINLSAEPEQTVAILGATGSGKSTIVNLLPRFYDVTQGRVTLDGVDVRDLPLGELREQIGMVLQESVLFTGTVRDNIAYGRPEASDEQVVACAKAAQAHDFIVGFPDGYQTMVGQRGVNLSGGQKQRIAIARALLIKPRVLVLDDSTSSVDLETEGRIQQALEEGDGHCTRLIIAQRISSVMDADKIAVLERGQVAAFGTHQELMASSPLYREIYHSQLGTDE